MQRIPSFDGAEIAVHVDGQGPPVLLLHGFAADHRVNWVAPGIVAALVAAGHRVIAPDARGHGQSAKPHDPAGYANDAMVQDARAVLDHFEVESVDVVGYSMGALTTTRLVLVEPRARSVVLGGIGARLSDRMTSTRRADIADALLTDSPRSVQNPIARAFRRFADRTGADKQALAALQRAPRPERPDLSKISVPALVISGDGDTIAGRPDELAALIPNATSRIVGGDHMSAIYAPAFAAEIVEFLGLRART